MKLNRASKNKSPLEGFFAANVETRKKISGDPFKKLNLFRPISCARQLIIGCGTNDRDSIPPKASELIHQKGSMKEGDAAYEMLLKIICGLQSKKRGDRYMLHDFRKTWKEFENNFEESSKSLSKIIENLIADARSIRNQFIQDKILPSISQAKIVDQNYLCSAEKILIIPSANRIHLLSNAIQVFAKKSQLPRKVYVAIDIEDDSSNAKILKALQDSLRHDSRLEDSLFLIPMKKAAKGYFRKFNTVVLIRSLKKNEFDLSLKEALESRHGDGPIIHIAPRCNENEEWVDSLIYNYIPSDQILAKTQDAYRENERLCDIAANACEKATFSRSLGLKPKYERLDLPWQEYTKAEVLRSYIRRSRFISEP